MGRMWRSQFQRAQRWSVAGCRAPNSGALAGGEVIDKDCLAQSQGTSTVPMDAWTSHSRIHTRRDGATIRKWNGHMTPSAMGRVMHYRLAETTWITFECGQFGANKPSPPVGTLWKFICGPPKEDCLGIPWPVVKQWKTAICEPVKCAPSCHAPVKETMLLVLCGHTIHDTVNGEKKTNDAMFEAVVPRSRSDGLRCTSIRVTDGRPPRHSTEERCPPSGGATAHKRLRPRKLPHPPTHSPPLGYKGPWWPRGDTPKNDGCIFHLGDPLHLVKGKEVFYISKMVFSCKQIQGSTTQKPCIHIERDCT